MEFIKELLAVPWVVDLLRRLLIVVVATMFIAGFGVAIAIKERRFEFGKLADFLWDWILPYSLAYAEVHVVVNLVLSAGLEFYGLEEVLSQAIANAIYGALIISLAAHIAGQIAVFLPGFKGERKP